jgi:hypothetical protein
MLSYLMPYISLGCPWNDQVIRGVDINGDKRIDAKDLEDCMKATEAMGTVGSVWRCTLRSFFETFTCAL